MDESYQYLINVINEKLDLYAPKKCITITHDERFREAWLTVKLKIYNQKCRKLCNRARASGSETDHKRYRQYRNVLNQIKLYEKRTLYAQLFKKIGKNSKLLWNVVNGIVRKTSNRTEITSLLYDNKVHSAESDICESLNKHFSSVGKKVHSTIEEVTDGDPYKFVKCAKSTLKFERVSESRICRIVMNMKPKTSSGLDGINNMLLKKLIHVIKGPLCLIANNSLRSGVFPDLMKHTKVVPLYKAGDKALPDNYHPISLLPVISKVLEKIVYEFMTTHLDTNNILYHRQYGFCKKMLNN